MRLPSPPKTLFGRALLLAAAFGVGVALTGYALPMARFTWSSFVHAGF